MAVLAGGALKLKKIGDEILATIGGRAVHPVGACVGDFYSIPDAAPWAELLPALKAGIDEMSDPPSRSRVPIEPRAGVGAAATEAPRGVLWHRYETDAQGLIKAAKIMPPTSQNQPQIEADLRALSQKMSHLDDEKLCLRCEHLIRNYDSCLSCSVHFLKLHVERLP